MKEQITSIEASYSKPIGRIKVTLSIEIDRKLTQDEGFVVSEKLDDIKTFLADNLLKNDPDYQRQGVVEQNSLLNCFDGHACFVRQIPNGYTQRDIGRPWFKVTTKKGHFIIGWRKSVIVIDWEDSDIEHDAKIMFPNEDVTRAGKLIHAWGYEKAKEYISVLLS